MSKKGGLFFISTLFVVCFGLGCSTPVVSLTPADVGEEPVMLYKPKPVDGSLWPQGADKNGLFADAKAAQVGDIVTITISEVASASKLATTATSKSSSQALSMSKIFGLGSNMGINDFLGTGQSFDPSLTTSNENDYSGSGSTTRTDNLTATMTAMVTEVLPSGNLRIKGKREVQVNNETQTLILTGTIRPLDIEFDNTISSTMIANAEIHYDGSGVVSDKQRVGWGTRVLDFIWPF